MQWLGKSPKFEYVKNPDRQSGFKEYVSGVHSLEGQVIGELPDDWPTEYNDCYSIDSPEFWGRLRTWPDGKFKNQGAYRFSGKPETVV
jgi:hypothetical protein